MTFIWLKIEPKLAKNDLKFRWGTKTVSTILLCNSTWLIMINIIIDNEKSPKIRINLNFPASSGCLIIHPANRIKD